MWLPSKSSLESVSQHSSSIVPDSFNIPI
jgi:hypothetical protein